MAFSSASMSRSNMRRCDALFFTAVKSQLQWLVSDERSFPENLGVKNWGGCRKKWATQFSEGENWTLSFAERNCPFRIKNKTCLSLSVKLLPSFGGTKKNVIGVWCFKRAFSWESHDTSPQMPPFFLGNKALLTTIIP